MCRSRRVEILEFWEVFRGFDSFIYVFRIGFIYCRKIRVGLCKLVFVERLF